MSAGIALDVGVPMDRSGVERSRLAVSARYVDSNRWNPNANEMSLARTRCDWQVARWVGCARRLSSRCKVARWGQMRSGLVVSLMSVTFIVDVCLQRFSLDRSCIVRVPRAAASTRSSCRLAHMG